jgi:dTDP-4-dehydrorhamnose 3,5-epimerase
MIFHPTEIPGAFVIDLETHADDRGFFARTFCEREMEAQGLPARFPQCNLSRNSRRGTLRGMHFQAGRTPEAKLVRCTAGAIYDVVVDLRRDSPARFRWFGVELTAESGRALFVPSGLAHGFVTLQDGTDVFYHMSDFFRADLARGFRWDDARFAIQWPLRPSLLSPRDAAYPDFDPERFDE